MMKMKKILPIAAMMLLLVLPGILWGQEYTLDQLTDIALQRVMSIRQEVLTLENARSQIRSRMLDFLPEASVHLGWQDNLDGYDRSSAGLSISKTVSLNESTWFNYKRELLNVSSAEIGLEELKQQVVYDLFSQYLTILSRLEELGLERENLKFEETLLEQTRILFEAGRRTDLDVRQAEISVLDARIRIDELQGDIEDLRYGLFRFLGIEDGGYPLSDPELTISEPSVTYQDPLDLRQREISLMSDSLTLRQNKLDWLPDISLGYSFDYSGSDDLMTEALNPGDWEDTHSVSLNLSYPLMNWWEQKEVVHRLERTMERARLVLEELRREKRERLDELIRSWQRSYRSYELMQQKAQLSADNLTRAEERYSLGNLSLIELDRARLENLQAGVQLNRQHYNLLIAGREIELLVNAIEIQE